MKKIDTIEYLAGECARLDKKVSSLQRTVNESTKEIIVLQTYKTEAERLRQELQRVDSEKQELKELRSRRYEAEKMHTKIQALQEEINLLKREKEELRRNFIL